MKKLQSLKFPRYFLIIAFGILFSNCTSTLMHKDESAGFNGDFEIVENGYPVNWVFLSKESIENKSYEVILDSQIVKSGKHSLKFLVHSVNDNSLEMYYNPGMFNFHIDGSPGETFKTSFWVRNEGCRFIAKINSQEHPLEYEENIVQTKDSIKEWKLFEYEYTIPPEYKSFGFYINIIEPGSFWIDDVRITKIEGD